MPGGAAEQGAGLPAAVDGHIPLADVEKALLALVLQTPLPAVGDLQQVIGGAGEVFKGHGVGILIGQPDAGKDVVLRDGHLPLGGLDPVEVGHAMGKSRVFGDALMVRAQGVSQFAAGAVLDVENSFRRGTCIIGLRRGEGWGWSAAVAGREVPVRSIYERSGKRRAILCLFHSDRSCVSGAAGLRAKRLRLVNANCIIKEHTGKIKRWSP